MNQQAYILFTLFTWSLNGQKEGDLVFFPASPLPGTWCPLTRFLRGRPSAEPDRRTPEELEVSSEEAPSG